MVSVVAVTSQPVWVEHSLVVLVITVGLGVPLCPVTVEVMKSVLDIQSSTVVGEVQVVVSEELVELAVEEDEEEVSFSFSSSFSRSSSDSVPSVKILKFRLNSSSSSFVISSG